MSENVGEVFIEAHADTSGLSAELRRAAAAAAEAAQIEVGTDLDDAELVAQVERAAQLAERFAKVEFQATLESGRLKAEAAALRSLSGGEITVDSRSLSALAGAFTKIGKKARIEVEGDFARFRRELAVELGRRTFVVKPEVDLTRVRSQIQSLRAIRAPDINLHAEVDNEAAVRAVVESLSRDRTVEFHLKTDFDRSLATARIDALRARLAANPITIPVNVDVDRSVGIFERLRDRISSIFTRRGRADLGQQVFGSLGGLFSGGTFINRVRVVIGFFSAQIVALTGVIVIALPFIKALAAALAGAAVEIGTAGLALGAFAATGVASVAAGIGTLALGTQGLSGAFKALNKVLTEQREGIGKSKEERAAFKKDLEAFNKSLKLLAPNARAFVLTVRDLEPTFHRLQLGVQQTLFKGLGDQIERTAKVVLPILERGLGGLAGSLNRAATGLLAFLRTPVGQKQLTDSFTIIQAGLDDLLTSAGNVGKGLLTLFVGGKKNSQTLGAGLVTLTGQFNKWTQQVTTPGKNGKTPLENFFDKGRESLGKIKGILGASGGLISGFWSAWTQAGANRPDILGDLQHQLETWRTALTDPANQAAVRQFFSDAKSNFDELKESALDVAGAINDISGAIQDFNSSQGTQAIDNFENNLDTFLKGSSTKTFWQGLLDGLQGFMSGGASGDATNIRIGWSLNPTPTEKPPWLKADWETQFGAVPQVDFTWAKTAVEGQPPWSNPNQMVPTVPQVLWQWAPSAPGEPPWSHPDQNLAGAAQGPVAINWKWNTLPVGDVGGPWSHPELITGAIPVEIGWKWNTLPEGERGGPWSHPELFAPIPEVGWKWRTVPVGDPGPPWAHPELFGTVGHGKIPVEIGWTWKTNPDPFKPPWSETTNIPPVEVPVNITPPGPAEVEALRQRLIRGLLGGPGPGAGGGFSPSNLPTGSNGMHNAIIQALQFTAEECQKVMGPLFGCIPGLINDANNRIKSFAQGIPPQFSGVAPGLQQWRGPIDDAISSWFANGPSDARIAASGIVSAFGNLAGRIVAAAGPVAARIRGLFAGVVGFAQGVANGIVNAFRGLAGRIARAAGNVAARIKALFAGAVSAAQAAAAGIVSAFRGLGSAIARAIGPIHIPRPVVPSPRIPSASPSPEPIVPDFRPRGMFALVNSGQVPIGESAALRREAPFLRPAQTTTVTQNIHLPTGDPMAAAMAVANRLALVRTM